MSSLPGPARRRRILGPGDFNFRRYGDIRSDVLHMQNVGRYELVYDIYEGFIYSILDALLHRRIYDFNGRHILLLPDLCSLFCLLEIP